MCEAIPNAPKTLPPHGKENYLTVKAGACLIRGAFTAGRKLAFTSTSGNKKLDVAKYKEQGKVTQFAKKNLFQLALAGTNDEFKIQSVANISIILKVWGNALTAVECKGTA
ncbi:unnamed protein product [Mucor hiemalis]